MRGGWMLTFMKFPHTIAGYCRVGKGAERRAHQEKSDLSRPMPGYVRAKIEGGTFFFTVTLADRSSNLLVQHIVSCGAPIAPSATASRSRRSRFAFCRITCMPSGACPKAMLIFPCVGT